MENSRFKFRVWNKFEENFVDSDEYAVTFNGIIFKANLDSDTYNNLISNENLILMQYTGLKDKNSAEIYEGDIVEYDREITKVTYENIMASFCVGGNSFDSSEAKYMKIIGNFYENPELLRED